jgi:hypothetical protein
MTDVSTTEDTSKDAVVSARQQLQRSDLENVLQTTRPRGWWALAVITVIIVVSTIWACVAKIPQTTSATGVVNALVYSYTITAPATGSLMLTGTAGGVVTSGTPVGTITAVDGSTVPINALISGEITAVSYPQGSFVELGVSLLTVSIQASSSSPVKIIAFVGESAMLKYPLGATVEISATDVVTGRSIYATATVVAEGSTPSAESSLNDVNGGSTSLSQKWISESSGYPYALFLQSSDWPLGDSGFTPSGGQVVSITRTYDSVHPISQLFGGK